MIANADAARIPLPDKSVHAVITSPPYFGPRKYKGEQARDWPAVSYSPMPGLPPLDIPAMRCELGREKTPEAYTAHLVLCFREIWRVLRDDGTCWVVEGDSYGGGNGGNATSSKKQRSNAGSQIEPARGDNPGQLLAIPYRLLLALQADGWLVRNDVVWSKVAPMPESVSGTHWERHQVKVRSVKGAGKQATNAGSLTNMTGGVDVAQWSDCPGCPRCSATGGYVLRRGSWRHTRSHESVLMLTKKMGYFANGEIVREGVGASGVVQLSDFDYEFMHFFDNFFFEDIATIRPWPPSGISDSDFAQHSLTFVRSILDFLEGKQDFGLGPFNAQIRQKLLYHLRGILSAGAPAIERLTSLNLAFIKGDISAKQFYKDFKAGLVNHFDVDGRAEVGARPLFVEPLHINGDGDTTFPIEQTSSVGELFRLVHTSDYTPTASPLSNEGGRNPRDVLTPKPSPLKAAHYAAFPPDLIRPLILSSAPLKCCPACGAGWAAVVEQHQDTRKPYATIGVGDYANGSGRNDGNGLNKVLRDDGRGGDLAMKQGNVIGYRPTCQCNAADWQPGLVLDPFAGSGTTGLVCRELGLRFVGLDISGEYLRDIALVRSERLTPDSAMVNLPLFTLLQS